MNVHLVPSPRLHALDLQLALDGGLLIVRAEEAFLEVDGARWGEDQDLWFALDRWRRARGSPSAEGVVRCIWILS